MIQKIQKVTNPVISQPANVVELKPTQPVIVAPKPVIQEISLPNCPVDHQKMYLVRESGRNKEYTCDACGRHVWN